MQAMTGNIRLSDELGQQLQARRKALGLCNSALPEIQVALEREVADVIGLQGSALKSIFRTLSVAEHRTQAYPLELRKGQDR